jgi:2,3-dihydroxyphenylpropionate 1,2-dioxygenase
VTSLKSGPVNEEWDREFLRLITEKDYQALRQWSHDFIEENGGNGGQEIHNWLVLLGILNGFEPEVACYEPIPEWVTGMGVVKFHRV